MSSTRSSKSRFPQKRQRKNQPPETHTATTLAFTPLPDVVKREIVSFLPLNDAKNLALANWEWKKATESHLWAELVVYTPAEIGHTERDSDSNAQRAHKAIRQHLESHPDRVPLVKWLYIHDWPESLGIPDDSSAIVRLVAPTAERLLETGFCQPHRAGTCAMATIPHTIFTQQPFPRMKRLHTHLDRNWPTSLPRVLRMMPNLTALSMGGESDWRDLAGQPTAWPILDRLTELEFESNVESANVVSTLLPLCSSLRIFELGLYDHAYPDEESDEFLKERISAMTSVILNCSTLESLVISHCSGPEFMPEFEPHRFSTDLRDYLPNLEYLKVMSTIVHPHCVPCQPTLRKLHMHLLGKKTPIEILSDRDYDRLYVEVLSGGSFGTRPSKTTSGKLSLALVTRLDSAQRLAVIVANNLSAGIGDFRSELHIQTFINGGRVLYHCRVNAKNTAFPLNCHSASYSPPFSISTRWKDQPRKRVERSRDHMHSENLNRPLSLDCQNDSHPEDPDATDLTTDEYELTYYKDHNLPLVLLDYVYSQIDCPRDWDTGERGLALPDHVWGILDIWAEGEDKLRVVV